MVIDMINNSQTLLEYKREMKKAVRLYCPNINEMDLERSLDYSINKRYKEFDISIENNYTDQTVDMTILEICDYIKKREPILTSYGVMFKKHAEAPNPLGKVIQSFLDNRGINKKKMFTFPKGSDDFEKYNLLQQLDKIDANGVYGVLGMYTSLIFNIYVAASITSQGRSLVSSAGLQFEMFLSNNVKFGSVDEVLTFISNVVSEKSKRKYNDKNLLDNNISIEDCFVKIISTCGYGGWLLPTEEELNIIYRVICNLSQEDINRLYYKNNLYEFINNKSMSKALIYIINKLDTPYLNPLECPKEIIAELDEFSDILLEYVYYGYQIIDRVDRMDQMVKNVCAISDTDSTIISLDAWYRCVLEKIDTTNLKILHQEIDVLKFLKLDDDGDIEDTHWNDAIKFVEPDFDFDFFTDEVIELEHLITPLTIHPQDNLRYSIINIMAYTLDKVINDYMQKFTENANSYDESKKCKIIMKNEFLFKSTLMTSVKKSYASILELQEGISIKQDQASSLEIKGIASMAKSSMSNYTRTALKKILYEDVLNCEEIDQVKVIKAISILEKKIIQSLYDGSKDYYKPSVVKGEASYDKPMSIQGYKASLVWNALKDDHLPTLKTNERNPVSIAKILFNPETIKKIETIDPELYIRCMNLYENPIFKKDIKAIAIPADVEVPKWLLNFIDYKLIVNENLGGFPLESIGIYRKRNSNVNYSNILKL